MKKPDYPVILTTPVIHPNGQWTQYFWCPFCKGYHSHGEGGGHRVAECWNPDSPFKRTGYIVKPVWGWAVRAVWRGERCRFEKLSPGEVARFKRR